MRDRDKRNMVLHSMLVTIQACIDIANHIIAERKLRRPATYRASFEILVEEKVIPVESGQALADLAGFRNVITHLYWRMDLKQVHEILKRDLSLIRNYLEIVEKYLKNRKK